MHSDALPLSYSTFPSVYGNWEHHGLFNYIDTNRQTMMEGEGWGWGDESWGWGEVLPCPHATWSWRGQTTVVVWALRGEYSQNRQSAKLFLQSSDGIGTSLTPHPQAIVSPRPLWFGGEGHTRWQESGCMGESQFQRGDIHCGTLYIYVLCGNIGCRRLSDRHDISDPRRAPKHIFMAKIAAVEHLKRVNGTICTIIKWFYRSKQKFSCWLFFTKRHLKIVKTISAHSQSTILILGT